MGHHSLTSGLKVVTGGDRCRQGRSLRRAGLRVSTTTTTPTSSAHDGATLTRRGLLGAGAGLLGASALGGLGVATAPVAEAATSDPVLHLVRRTTYGATPELLAAVRTKG